MSVNTNGYKDEYKEYTMGLALLDMMPVLLFLMSGLIIYSMYDNLLLLVVEIYVVRYIFLASRHIALYYGVSARLDG